MRAPVLGAVSVLALLVAALFVAGFFPTAADEAVVVLGGIALLYGTFAFVAHGGGRITALGLFNFAFALFFGYGGIAEGTDPVRRTSAGYVSLAISVALVVQILVNLSAWRRASPADEAVTMPQVAYARWATWVGAVGMALIFTAQRLDLSRATSAVADGTVFACVVMLAVGLLYRHDTRLLSLRLGCVVVALAIYAEVFHQGSGRLRLVALACVIGLLLTARFPHRGIKWAVVAVAPIAIWWLAQDRLALQESIAAGASAGRTGLESMTTPILVLAQIIRAISGPGAALDPSWGHTFLSVPFILVPEALQPTWVPDALGYQLVGLVDPGRLGTGFSVAGTVYGEAYWNAGWAGPLLAVPLLGWLLGVIDARFRSALTALAERPQALVVTVFWVMLAGGIADLSWNGTHVWVARHLTRLPLLAVVGLLIWLRARRAATSAGRAPRTPLPAAQPSPPSAAAPAG